MAANARKATTWVGKIVLGGQGRKILYSGVDLGDIGDIGDIGNIGVFRTSDPHIVCFLKVPEILARVRHSKNKNGFATPSFLSAG